MTSDRQLSRPGAISAELRPYVDRHETEEMDRLGEHLTSVRPRPRPAFRSELRAQLTREGAIRDAWRPKRLRVLVASYLASGLVLLAAAGIGLTGVGPLA